MPGEAESYDYVIVGSGFGGSVSALRLTEKGYRVLVLEQGEDLSEVDFPRSNWNVRRWLWMPALGFRGILQFRPFRNVVVLAGAGVGGGSLGYAATLPMPPGEFFTAGHWSTLADWRTELAPHYATARRMLGATPAGDRLFDADRLLREVAREVGREEQFGVPDVGIFLGDEAGSAGDAGTDPYFGGEGPQRHRCTHCGGCMTGCRVGAKNSLDKNYLFFARRNGAEVHSNTHVDDIVAEEGGYVVHARHGRAPLPWLNRRVSFRAGRVIFSAGVLGTVELLLRLRQRGRLPGLSARLGRRVMTNSEALIGVTTRRRDLDFSRGVAIGSMLQTDEHSHVEAVRYSAGSGLWRTLAVPHIGANVPGWLRPFALVASVLAHPLAFLKTAFVPDHAKYTAILLYMRSLEGSLRFRLRRGLVSWFRPGFGSQLEEGAHPTASMPEATDLARRYARLADGMAVSIVHESLLNVPTTAHILGGCCMGISAEEGVVDRDHVVFGYPRLMVVDGSVISANPGVNPSLTITALAERAMSRIPEKARIEVPPRQVPGRALSDAP